MERKAKEVQKCICEESGETRALGAQYPRCPVHDTKEPQ